MNIARRIERIEARIGDAGRRCPECGERIDSQTAMLLNRLANLSGQPMPRCRCCGVPPLREHTPVSTDELVDRLNAIAARVAGASFTQP